MAKKKTTTTRGRKSKKQTQQSPQYELPSGFWTQVFAIVFLAFSVLLVVSWFGGGGALLNWIRDMSFSVIGWASYVLPFVCAYVAIQVFRAEDNKVPFLIKSSAFMVVVLFSGLFGLFRKDGATSTGGIIGDSLNTLTLSMVNMSVGVFIYVVFIAVMFMILLRLSVNDIMNGFVRIFGKEVSSDDSEDKNDNKRLSSSDTKSTAMAGFKLNAGVPILNSDDKKKNKIPSLKNSSSADKESEEKAAMLAVSDPNWKFPSIDLLEKKQTLADAGDIKQNALIIQDTLKEFNIDVEMEGANIGPRVTQYTLKPPAGIKLSKISSLETNIALNLAASSLRIEAPIPGKKAVGIEVPNKKSADVRIRGIFESSEWKKAKEPLSFVIGRDISGNSVVGELNKMPHLLVAGQTGSGKSVMINTLLCSLLYRNSPSDMKLILVDPKQVEMAPYENIPHLLTPVIIDPEKTISALKWAVNEMERRYSLLAEERVRDIKTYNEKVKKKSSIEVKDDEGNIKQVNEGHMPYIVIVVDELADLMMVAAREVEALIVRIAQKARAVGIHLVLATQRPSVDVITGLIKANVPARIAFTVASQVDSRTILDQIGSEKLLGQGDMLIKTAQIPKPRRVQGAWVTDEEVLKITSHLCMQSAPQYNDEVTVQPVQLKGKGGVVMDFDSDSSDDMFRDACRVVVESRKASTSLLQRKLRIGYSRASRIIDEMEEQGIIGPQDGSRAREVLISNVDDIDNITADV